MNQRIDADKHSLELKVVRLVDDYAAAREKWKQEQPNKQKASAASDYKEKLAKLLDEVWTHSAHVYTHKHARAKTMREMETRATEQTEGFCCCWL